ncbi:MAG: sigma factor-like helix-turn-helix DNA-binding protein [Waterburya sp.]
MDICQQLEAKYPGSFQKLINHYQSLLHKENCSVLVNRRRTEKLITNLLTVDNWHGEALQMHLHGYSLAEIGRKANLSRERIRQIIHPYKKYLHEIGSKDWCEVQLKKLLDSYPETGVLPSNEEIKNFHSKLLPSIKQHFIGKKGSTLRESERLEIVKALNLDIEAEIKNHKTWSEERLIYEVREFAKKIGKPDLMPMQLELGENGRGNLRGAIQRFGGQSKVAQLTGLKYQGQTVAPDGSRTYWTEERIRAFLYDVAEKEGHPGWMPTQAACMKHSPRKNASIITIFTRAFTSKEPTLSWVEVADKYRLKYDTDNQRITLSYIRSFVKSLGDTLHNLTPAEIYVLFEQQGINKAKTRNNRTFDNLVQAIQSGNLPREEIDNWASGQPSELTEELLNPKNQTVEEAFRKANKSLKKTSHKSKAENSQDKSYQEDVDAELPIPKVVDTLNSLSATTNILISSSCDTEAIDFLIAKAKAKLWKRCFVDQESALAEAKQHQGNIYSEQVRDSFIDEYTRCQQLPLPSGYSFKDDKGVFRQPKLMQRLIAYRVLKDERVLNLSGTGTGKTLSAVLASRVIGAQLTVIACPNSTVQGWVKTIKNAFPQSEVIAKPTRWMVAWPENNLPRYLVANHQMFQNMYEGAIKRFINNNPIDFV